MLVSNRKVCHTDAAHFANLRAISQTLFLLLALRLEDNQKFYYQFFVLTHPSVFRRKDLKVRTRIVCGS